MVIMTIIFMIMITEFPGEDYNKVYDDANNCQIVNRISNTTINATINE